ncbi:hypothetical protein DFH11DRAFT_1304052 [Phellopilus nigrolimitatus]|nr:hypothetical protein DFH11DRAFT_1304052 [Phellopilus nigrolimitatus]
MSTTTMASSDRGHISARQSPDKPKIRPKSALRGAGPSQQRMMKDAAATAAKEPTVPPVPPVPPVPLYYKSDSTNEKHIIAKLDDERRRIRTHNRNYFRSQIWDPALRKDFVGAYQFSHSGDDAPAERAEVAGRNVQGRDVAARRGLEREASATKRNSENAAPARKRLVTKTKRNLDKEASAGRPVATKRNSEKEVPARPSVAAKRSSEKEVPKLQVKMPEEKVAEEVEDGEGEWARSVRLALAKLESNMAHEDPRKYVKPKRDSFGILGWQDARKRTSQARLSALATGYAQPNSAFEEAFVAELLRANEVAARQSSTPLANAKPLFSDIGSGIQSPHYSLPGKALPPTPMLSQGEPTANKRKSVFDQRKAARRAGRAYKSFSAMSTFTFADIDSGSEHGSQCFDFKGFWKRFRKAK